MLEYRPQSPLLESNVDGDAKQSTEEETGEEPTSGMGIGIVIGIILIVILVLGSVAESSGKNNFEISILLQAR